MREVLYEESANPSNLKTQKFFYTLYTAFMWFMIIAAFFCFIFEIKHRVMPNLFRNTAFLIVFFKLVKHLITDFQARAEHCHQNSKNEKPWIIVLLNLLYRKHKL